VYATHVEPHLGDTVRPGGAMDRGYRPNFDRLDEHLQQRQTMEKK